MYENDHTYLVSAMLTDLREHSSVLRKGLALSVVLLLLALVASFIPWDNDELALLAPALAFFAFIGDLCGLCCIIMIDKRIAVIQKVRSDDMASRAEGLLGDNQ